MDAAMLASAAVTWGGVVPLVMSRQSAHLGATLQVVHVKMVSASATQDGAVQTAESVFVFISAGDTVCVTVVTASATTVGMVRNVKFV
jgi:hypothetical protein